MTFGNVTTTWRREPQPFVLFSWGVLPFVTDTDPMGPVEDDLDDPALQSPDPDLPDQVTGNDDSEDEEGEETDGSAA